MKIGVYFSNTNHDVGGNFTHSESAILGLARQAAGSRHSVVMVSITTGYPESIRQAGISVVSLDHRFDLRFCRRLAARMATLAFMRDGGIRQALLAYRDRQVAVELRRRGIDILLCLQHETPTLDFPYVLTILDLQHRRQGFWPEVSYGGIWKERERFFSEAISRSCFVIATNNVGKREVEQYFAVPADRVFAVPHFTPDWVWNSCCGSIEPPAEIPLGIGKFIFYPAQFWPHKNHVVILKAVAHLREHHAISIKVIFSGSDKGSMSHVKAWATKLGVSDLVFFVGFVSRSTIIWLYRNALALVYASMFGPENLPPLEAMALGCPVICAEFDGAREQLGSSPMFFAAQDYVVLSQYIITLLQEGPSRSAALAGRALAERRTPDEFAREVLRLMDNVENVLHCWQ